MQKNLNLFLENKIVFLLLQLPFLLDAPKTDYSLNEECYKQNTIGFYGLISIKMPLALPAKIIVFYIRFIVIQIW